MPSVYSWEAASRGRGGGGASAAAPAGENAERILTALNGYTVPFSYNTPADPVSTSSATVTTATIVANIVAGRTLTLQAGAYGTPNFNVDDLDIICQAGVTFTSFNMDGSRIRITGPATTGGSLTAAPTFASGSTDLMIDNISVNLASDVDSMTPANLTRVCFKNNDWRQSGQIWVMIGGDACVDMFILQTDSEYTGSNSSRCPLRLVAVTRLIIVNNRFASSQAGVRLHNNTAAGAMSNLAFSQNQIECSFQIEPDNGGGDGDEFVLGPSWAVDNNSYRPGITQMCSVGNSTPANVQDATITGNRGYGSATEDSNMTSINTGTGSTVSDNLNKTYVSTPAYGGGVQ